MRLSEFSGDICYFGWVDIHKYSGKVLLRANAYIHRESRLHCSYGSSIGKSACRLLCARFLSWFPLSKEGSFVTIGKFSYFVPSTHMSWFDRIFRFLLIALPFHVVLTVFFQFRLGIPGISLYKEVLVILMTVLLGMHFFRVRHVPKPDWLDWSILAYMAYLVLATIFNGLSVGHFVYGGRADFLFLWFFLVVRHGTPLLAATHATYVKMFLTSASVALVLSILVRFGVGESVLLWLGFSADLSNWQFGGSVPIYHGIPGANVRRFQGILDGPNPMAFFLILYITLLVQAFRHKKDWLFAIGLVCIFCLGLLFLTYSRSAFVGLFGAIVLSGLVWAGVLFRRHLRAVLVGICIFAGIG